MNMPILVVRLLVDLGPILALVGTSVFAVQAASAGKATSLGAVFQNDER
jgi:hypothetical protein